MGRASQLKLLLWKNFTIRKRQHLRVLVEIVLPLVLFLILALVRITRSNLLERQHECHFEGKAMPTAGALPFFQSLLCTSSNTCHKTARQGELMGQVENFNTSLITRLYKDVEDVLGNRMEVDAVTRLIEDYYTFRDLIDLGQSGSLDCEIKIGDIIVSQEVLQQQIQDQNINLNPEMVERLLNASFNFTEVYKILNEQMNNGTFSVPSQDDLLNTIRNQTGMEMPENMEELADRIREELCVSGNREEWVLVLDDRSAQNELVDALCNLTLTQFETVFEDIREDLSYFDLIEQISKCTNEKFGKKINFDRKQYQKLLDLQSDIQSLQSLQDIYYTLNISAQEFMGNYTNDTNIMQRMSDFFCGRNEDIVAATEMEYCKDKDEKTGKCKDEEDLGSDDEEIPEYEYDYTATPFCNDIFQQLHNTTGGRILWTQIKPMIRGRIPYAPDTPAVRRIIKEANASFASMAELKRLAVDWAETYPNLTRDFEESPQVDRVREALGQLNTLFPGTRVIETYNRWIQKYPAYPGQYTWRTSFNYTTVMLNDLKNYLDCFQFNKFEGYANETELEKASLDYISKGLFWSGLVFNMDGSDGETMPPNITYKIRMDSSRVDTTFRSRVLDRYWTPGPRASPLPDMKYIVYGFIYIQDMVEHGIIRLQTNLTESEEVGMYIQQFPYPCYIRDKFVFAISRGLPMFMVLAWIFTVAMNVKSIVYEKEQRLKEVMKIMGLSDGIHWQAWFITCFLMMLFTIIPLILILKAGGVLPHSDPSVILVFLLAFTVSTITFCFMMSVFFSKAKLAAAAAGLIYFTFYLPYPACYSFEEFMTTWQKSIASLSSPVAFGYGCSYTARYEEQQIGIQWSNIASSPIPEDGYSMLGCIIMLVADAVIYMIITWYVEAVFPGQFGVPRPWYFFATRSYWCGIEYNVDDVGGRRNMEMDQNQQASNNFEKEPSGAKVGVSIKGLRKTYSKNAKPAVDGLNLNFYEGQITSFLGHNGAGKTTTMSILSGLFPPSEGTAYIYNQDIRTDMDNIRQSMGMCPQYNVLFDGLSVEDHMWFYARLKGMPNSNVQQETTQMIGDLGLLHKRQELSKNLSGGMKRKLSVAIAFVAGSKVVILDEPTAGVDPCARRSIWDLLLKYRKDRTILLSTHFMDEADVLGDRIAIISQGKLITCGSSLFLKSRFGCGYYLTMVKSGSDAGGDVTQRSVTDVKMSMTSIKVSEAGSEKDEGVSDMDTNSEFSDDSKRSNNSDVSDGSPCSDLTKFIKQFMSAAKMVEDVGSEVTYQLPSGREHTASFEKLFKALDKNLGHLGVSSYGISDTTLEEVFLKVADVTGQDEEMTEENKRSQLEQITDGGNYARPVTRLSFRSKLGFLGMKKKQELDRKDLMNAVDSSSDAEDIAVPLLNFQDEQGSIADVDLEDTTDASDANMSTLGVTPEEIATCNGAGSHRVEGLTLKWKQFYALIVKRFLFLMRSRKSFFVQIVWPALFICLAQLTMTAQPSTSHEPPMEVHPWLMLPPNMNNPYLYTFFSNDAPKMNWTNRMEEQLTGKPSMGNRCMKEEYHTITDYECKDPDESESMWTEMVGEINDTVRRCDCETTGYQQCPDDAGDPVPPTIRLATTDYLLNMTGRNITNYLIETTQKYSKRIYGGLSFGERNPLVEANYTQLEEYTKRLLVAANGGKDLDADITLPRFLEDIDQVLSSMATKRNAKIWFNNKGYVSNVGYMNIMNNVLLRSHLPPSADPTHYGITLINHPMNRTEQQLTAVRLQNAWVNVLMAICVIMALSVIPASFSLFLVHERVSGSKHLQLVSGVNPAIYWVSNFAWDTLNYVIACLLCIFIFLGFQQEAFISPDNFPCLVGLLMLYGWAVTPLMYLGAYVFKVPSSAIVGLSCANIFLGFISTIATFIVEIMAEQENDEELRQINYILMRVFLLLPQYCLGRGLIDMATNQMKSDVLAMLGNPQFTSPLSWSLVGRNLLCLAVMGVLLFACILLLEYRCCKGRISCRKRKQLAVDDVMDEDVDVKRERQRVMGGQAEEDILRIEGLTKIYHKGKQNQHVAVDNLAVGVHKGECFGLLGVNGAGKTSTFKMLTGDTSVSGGNAHLAGHSILTELVSVHQNLGYCPQFDALCPLMTGLEHLTFYARLRGVPEADIKVVRAWGIKKLGLIRHANKLSQEYSGGNKRKLSTAIALIGNPPVIFLDEPTTGMDPKARRFLWTCITNILRDGRSVILTSHSMEECEALCSRIGIMVNGRFQCLGSIQHIKNRFGEGYTLMIRVTTPQELEPVNQYIRDNFPSAQLKDKQNNMIQYQMPSHLQLAAIFGKLERERDRLKIEDYSVSQTTLDQVFIYFANKQKDSEDDMQPDYYTSVGADNNTHLNHNMRSNNYEVEKTEMSVAELVLEDPTLRNSTLNLVSAEVPPHDDPLVSVC